MLIDWLGWELELREFVGGVTIDLLIDSLDDNPIGPGWFS
jgi:hypothetical protein